MRTTEKLGYILLRPYHLCHLEALNTLRKVVMGEPMLINNSANPHLTVAAIAKQDLVAGNNITRGAGGFEVRGVAVKLQDNKNAIPICLLQNTRLIRNIEVGQTITFDDVDLANTKALEIYQHILQ